MITNHKINLTDDELRRIKLRISNKKGKATRKEVLDFAERAFKRALNGGLEGTPKTAMVNAICPKCSRPISINAPIREVPVPAKEPEAKPRTQYVSRSEHLGQAAVEAARALDQAAAALNNLASHVTV